MAALRLTPSSSALPAHPTLVAVDLGDGPQVRRLDRRGGPQTLELEPRVTDIVKVSLLDWDDVIDRTALGFDQLKPPGLAEVAALDARGAPIAAADAARNRAGRINLPCGQGPIIGVAGQFVQTSVDHHRRRAARRRARSPAKPCRPEPITLPAGQQELLISPGAGVRRRRRPAGRPACEPNCTRRATDPVTHGRLERRPPRASDVPAVGASRVLVVPESINPGWTARAADGARADPGHRQRVAAGLGASCGHRRAPSR